MIVRPGRHLVRGGIALALFALGVFVWTPLVAVLAAVAAAVGLAAVWDWVRARSALRGVRVHRVLPAVVGRDIPFTATLELQNGTDAPWQGELRDVCPPECVPRLSVHPFALPPAGRVALSQEYRIGRRGRYTFGPVWVRAEGPWGLIDAQRVFESTGSIRILPETFASRDRLIQDLGAQALLLDKITFARQHGVGMEFESLYPYRLGDDPRRIDWRATARYRFPIVRRYQVERHRDVMIVLDCGRLMGTETDRGSKLDCGVDAALNLARVALASGDRCGIGVFDDRVRGYLPPVSGAASIRTVAECVYDVQTHWRESDFTQMFAELQLRQTKRSLVVVISDLGDVETSRQFRAGLVQLGRRHLVLFAALQTPVLQRVVREEPRSLLDGARKAVVFRLLRERQEALHALQRSGVYIVDVPPHRLTLPLINQFLDLRRKNLL